MVNHNIISIIYNFIFFLTLILLNIFSSDSLSLLTLCLLYCFIYLNIFFNPHNVPIPLLFIIGLLIDSINDIFLGISSTMFILSFILIKFELKSFKNIDFVNTYIIFIINALLFTLAISLGVLIVSYDHIIIPLKICITSIILLPITYYLTILYKYIYNRNENTI